MPAGSVLDLVEDDFACMKGVQSLECDGCDHCADERLPHRFVREIVGKLFQREENATNRGAEGYGDSRSSSCRKDFSLSSFVLANARERFHDDIGTAAGHMDQRAFFANPKARGNGKTLHS